jgi:molybdate transport system ATP-binding protein
MKAAMGEMARNHSASTMQVPDLPVQDRLDSVEAKDVLANHNLQVHVQKRLGDFVLEVEFQAGPGFTILFGASGAGKTTILDCVSGLLTPDGGYVQVGERVLHGSASRINVAVPKRGIGYVFQNLALFPHLSVEQNVAYGLTHLPRPKRAERVQSILQAFHVNHVASRSARTISGGESQRVALARTLVTNPTLLLLDEPLSALDAPTKSKIIDDLREWNRTHLIPILYVTHSREEVFALGERVIVLDRGRILAQGTPHDVMTAPLEETVAQLAGFENIFDATVESVHPDQGSMTCRIGADNAVLVETPLVRASVGSTLRVGIRAGDILLATSLPYGLSARNVISGQVRSLEQRDVIVSCCVECGTAPQDERRSSAIQMEVHLTLAARHSLGLAPGKLVWLVIKTHSCHLMRVSGAS